MSSYSEVLYVNYFRYLTLILLFLCNYALAVPTAVNFQANIRKPDGTKLESSDVSFRFKYLNAAGTCTVYIEDFNNQSMVGSGGNISLKMGSGAKVFPPAAVELNKTFNNSLTNTMSCSEGGSYPPTLSDEKRILSVEFVYTGSGGLQSLSGIEINTVPYALYANDAEDAEKLGGFAAALFLKFSDVTTCTGGNLLQFNGSAFSCVAPGAATSFTGSLSGDVSGTQTTTVVDSVGGKTAVQISTSVDDTLNATSSATASRIVKRDGSGNASFVTAQATNFSGRNLLLFEPTDTNYVTVKAPTTFAAGNYILTLPDSKGTAGQVLSTDGNGVTTWIPASSGSVTNVTAGAPLLSSGGATPNITMPAATAAVDGYLSAANFTTFNNKVSSQWTNSGSDIYFDSGNVGIGSYPTSVPLTVTGSNQAPGSNNDGNIYVVTSDSQAANLGGSIGFGGQDGGGSDRVYATAAGRKENSTSGNYGGYFAVETRPNGGSLVENLRITSLGRMGVGLTNPQYKLDVNGDVNIPAGSNFKINGVNIGSGSIGGSGTTNQLSKFTAAGTIGDSNISDNGAIISISTDALINGLRFGRGTGSNTENTAAGSGVLLLNTSGIGNTAHGYEALASNTSGNYNSAVGFHALNANTTGSANAALGDSALESSTGGSENAAVGDDSLQQNTTGNNNTAIGQGALSSNSTGNNNSALGHHAGDAITTGSNNVVIGTNSGSSIATSSNNIILSDGSGNIRQQINSSGLVGIGMAPATYMLSVNGDVNIPAGSNFKINGVNIGAGTIGGSGTTNQISKFTAAGTIGDSNISDNGSLVAISTDATIHGLTIGRGGGSSASNTALGATALISNTSGFANLAIGPMALNANTTGSSNIAVGYHALELNLTGDRNIATGMYALSKANGAYDNVATGYGALRYNTSGSSNTAFGTYSLQNATNANNNSAFGDRTLSANTVGTNNTAMGSATLQNNDIGSQNTASGNQSMAQNTSGANNTAMGYNSLQSNTTGTGNSVFGIFSGSQITTGSNNVVIGSNDGSSIATSDGNIIISDGLGNIRYQSDSVGHVGIGMVPSTYALSVNGDINIPAGNHFKINGVDLAFGVTGAGTTDKIAKYTSSGTIGDSNITDDGSIVTISTDLSVGSNVTVGHGAGAVSSNTAVGTLALSLNAGGYSNTAIGDGAMRYSTNGANNVAVGTTAMANTTSGYANTAVGNLAMFSTTTGALNAAFGLQSMQDNTIGNRNTSVGDQSLQMNVAKSESTAIGYYSMQYANNSTSAGSTFNTAVGAYSLQGTVTAANNTGTGNTSLGHSTLRNNTTGTNNVAVGVNALTSNADGNFNVAVGDRAMTANTGGEQNVAIGIQSMFSNTTGNDNLAVGSYSLLNNTTGAANIAHGYEALVANTTGNANIAIGTSALGGNTTGSNNIALGHNGGGGITTGSYNVVIGNGGNIGAGSNNIIISDGQANIRIQVDSSGRVGMGVAPTQALDVVGNIKASGCVYYSGGSVGVCASDEKLKENIHAFDLGLETLLGINPVHFKYNGKAGLQFNGQEQIGVIAQDLEKAAPSLVKRQMVHMNPEDHEKTEIKVVDYGAFTYVVINSIKDLYHQWFADSVVLHREIASVKEENVQLKQTNEKIQNQNVKITHENEKIKQENEQIKQRLDRIEKILHTK